MWKTGRQRISGCSMICKRRAKNAQEFDQGEKDGAHSDNVAQHLGGMVACLPITPWGDRRLLSFH
jgi:hypothetical protein